MLMILLCDLACLFRSMNAYAFFSLQRCGIWGNQNAVWLRPVSNAVLMSCRTKFII